MLAPASDRYPPESGLVMFTVCFVGPDGDVDSAANENSPVFGIIGGRLDTRHAGEFFSEEVDK
jgi:hypothetical protein